MTRCRMALATLLGIVLSLCLGAGCGLFAGPATALAEEVPAPFATYRWGWGHHGSGLGQHRNPTGIAAYRNPIGVVNVAVADTGNARIAVFTDRGAFLEKWGEPGTGPSQYNSPTGLALTPRGRLFVADSGNHRVQQTNAWTNAMTELSGRFLGQLGRHGAAGGELDRPSDVAVDAEGHLFIVDSGNDRMQKLAADGAVLATWGGAGTEAGRFDRPLGVALGPDGSVYVTDARNQRVQRFDAGGGFLGQWGEAGDGRGQFFGPAGIAVDGEGRVYVVDRGNHRVQVFDRDGRWLGSFGTKGTGKGQLVRPYGVAVDDADGIYVTDTGNHRVQVFARR